MGRLRERGVAAALSALVLLLTATGCHYPAAIQTYEYVIAYGRMSDAYDPVLSLLYVPAPVSLADYSGLVIGRVDVGGERIESLEEAGSFATFFRIVLRSRLARLGKFDFVTLDREAGEADVTPPGRTLLLEGKITAFDTGSGLLRYLTYFLLFIQAGATDFQFEGRIVEPDSGRLLMEFVDRRRHFCNTPFGPNPRNFRKGFAMKVTVTETAACLSKFIEMAWDGLPAVNADVPADELPEMPREEGA